METGDITPTISEPIESRMLDSMAEGKAWGFGWEISLSMRWVGGCFWFKAFEFAGGFTFSAFGQGPQANGDSDAVTTIDFNLFYFFGFVTIVSQRTKS